MSAITKTEQTLIETLRDLQETADNLEFSNEVISRRDDRIAELNKQNKDLREQVRVLQFALDTMADEEIELRQEWYDQETYDAHVLEITRGSVTALQAQVELLTDFIKEIDQAIYPFGDVDPIMEDIANRVRRMVNYNHW